MRCKPPGFLEKIWKRLFFSWLPKVRLAKYLLLGAKVKSTCKIYGSTKVTGWYHNINIGNAVTLNEGVFFNARACIRIGDKSRISSFVKFYTAGLANERNHVANGIVIGENVWIGSAAIILPGVSIGDNSVVGAGSVVTKDVDPNSLYVGNPATKKKTLG